MSGEVLLRIVETVYAVGKTSGPRECDVALTAIKEQELQPYPVFEEDSLHV
jgi:hypothetical protein